MFETIADWLVDPAGLTPHGFCLLWEPGLIWTHALSDIAIGLAYFTIPLALTIVVHRRRDLMFRPVFWLFAAFILLCGTGHWLDLLTLWVPAYGLEAVVKAATAVVSVGTAITVWRLLPQALALPSPQQLRHADAALRESEARHRASFEQSPVPLHTLDHNGVITGVSNSWLTLFGYSHEDAVGRRIWEFQEPGSAWSEIDQLQLMSGSEARDIEKRFVHRNGDMIDALVSARMERLGDTTWIVCVVIDITARRSAEKALRASEEHLRQAQKMEAVGQLTGGIAHDFNNMLQQIGGSLDLMEQCFAEEHPGGAARYVAEARQSVERAARLTHRMLAFARRQSLQPKAVEADALVCGIHELIRRTMGPEVQVRLRLGDSLWRALCDANQLENGLINLAINARDAMPDGGMLTITTADRVLTRADLPGQDDEGYDAAKPGEYVAISVADTGAGMTPEVLERAFEPFFTTKPIGKGTGLGLSQLYGFVRQSGGLVRLTSQPGDGTAATLYLPRYHEADCKPSAPAKPNLDLHGLSARGRIRMSGTVLVVDDERIVRSQISETLRRMGCTVVEADDGPSGLKIVESYDRLDMVVTDVGLPGLDGRQLADAARLLRPGMPVLLITGYAGKAVDTLDLPPGIEMLQKPFSLDAIRSRVCAMLDAQLVR